MGCTLCPRECGADRENSVGFCREGAQAPVQLPQGGDAPVGLGLARVAREWLLAQHVRAVRERAPVVATHPHG